MASNLELRLRRVRRWAEQPTTVIGLMTVAGAATAAYLGDPATSWVPVLVGGVFGLLLPDNAHSPASQRFITDALEAAVSRRVPESLPSLVAEGQEALASMTKTTTTALPSGDAVLVDTQTTTFVPTNTGAATSTTTTTTSPIPVLAVGDPPAGS